MCGIWASVGLRPSHQVIGTVAHRGPDGSGWWETDTDAGPIVLAHHRLAVFETSEAGAQPMVDGGGRYRIVFNGAIYNHVELRDELVQAGHRFRSHADTEVLLAAYAEWGEACLDRLNGMFAFVVWDAEAQRLFAARDRFGIKPLYYRFTGDGLAFASEIKQLFASNGGQARLNDGAAFDFLALGMVDHDGETLFDGVLAAPAGACAIIETRYGGERRSLDWRPWYKRPKSGTLRLPAAEAAERLRELMRDSVALRLRADVSVGSCLSGGLDSSAIVSLAAGETGKRENAAPLLTVSACYEDPDIDETPFIDIVNDHAGARPVKVSPVGDDLVNTIDALHRHQEGPTTTSSVFAQWTVFKAASAAGAKVMLDGQGADEQLGGYHTAFSRFHAGLFRSLRWRRLARETAATARRHGASVTNLVLSMAAANLPRPVRGLVDLVRDGGPARWLSPEFARAGTPRPSAAQSFDALMIEHLFETSLPMLLRYEDRNSMAHGIESRLPFLDFRVVEFLIGLGDAHKIVDGETKWILRRAMNGIVPTRILERQDKIAFATPEAAWLRTSAAPLVPDAISEVSARFPRLFSAPGLERLFSAFSGGHSALSTELWRVVSFAAWARAFDVSE